MLAIRAISYLQCLNVIIIRPDATLAFEAQGHIGHQGSKRHFEMKDRFYWQLAGRLN